MKQMGQVIARYTSDGTYKIHGIDILGITLELVDDRWCFFYSGQQIEGPSFPKDKILARLPYLTSSKVTTVVWRWIVNYEVNDKCSLAIHVARAIQNERNFLQAVLWGEEKLPPMFRQCKVERRIDELKCRLEDIQDVIDISVETI